MSLDPSRTTYRGDDPETQWELRYKHLKTYLAAGVTTVLDVAIGAPILRDIQNYMNNGGIGPRIFALGPAFINTEGYLDDPKFYGDNAQGFFPSAVADAADVRARFDEYGDLENIIGIKVFVEMGMARVDSWPTWNTEKNILRVDIGFDDERIDAIMAESQAR